MDCPHRKHLTRRQFLKRAATAVALPHLVSMPSLLYPPPVHASGESELIIAKQGSPAQLLQAALAPLGGMGRFVKQGQRVVIKANIAWARTPEQGCTNNPELFMALIKMCYDAGAKRVAVWDHTCDSYQFTVLPLWIEGCRPESGGRSLLRSGHALTGCIREKAITYLIIEAVILEFTGLSARREFDKKTQVHLPVLGKEDVTSYQRTIIDADSAGSVEESQDENHDVKKELIDDLLRRTRGNYP